MFWLLLFRPGCLDLVADLGVPGSYSPAALTREGSFFAETDGLLYALRGLTVNLLEGLGFVMVRLLCAASHFLVPSVALFLCICAVVVSAKYRDLRFAALGGFEAELACLA